MDDFFRKTECDRCKNDLNIRGQSWFNDNVVCANCLEEEIQLKSKLLETRGDSFEGCGLHISQIRMMCK